MSFRANLQYLRAQRNMPQEQLAMLLGVSRQAISKWESEKAYPEMDKLLMICDLFGCTLDDLVLGDVSASVNVGAAARGGRPWLGCQNRNRGGSRGTRVYEGC
jgi:transcriptional regulator with XRE-family HTH domain